MADRGLAVAAALVLQGPGREQEEQVVAVAVVGQPEVPQPGVVEPQPFTPAEAMLRMNCRCRARNITSTGMVISVE